MQARPVHVRFRLRFVRRRQEEVRQEARHVNDQFFANFKKYKNTLPKLFLSRVTFFTFPLLFHSDCQDGSDERDCGKKAIFSSNLKSIFFMGDNNSRLRPRRVRVPLGRPLRRVPPEVRQVLRLRRRQRRGRLPGYVCQKVTNSNFDIKITKKQGGGIVKSLWRVLE